MIDLKKNARFLLVIGGALSALGAALSHYLTTAEAPSMTGLLVALATGLIGWAAKAPGTLTKAQAQAQVDDALRASTAPKAWGSIPSVDDFGESLPPSPAGDP